MPAFKPLREINLAKARLLALFDKEFAQRLMSWRIESASHPSVLGGLFAYGKFAYFRKAGGLQPYGAISPIAGVCHQLTCYSAEAGNRGKEMPNIQIAAEGRRDEVHYGTHDGACSVPRIHRCSVRDSQAG
jgi:hypothetical protein